MAKNGASEDDQANAIAGFGTLPADHSAVKNEPLPPFMNVSRNPGRTSSAEESEEIFYSARMATLAHLERGDAASIDHGHSLPTHHDMEGETIKSSGRRRTVVLLALVLVLVGIIVGLTVGFLTKGDDDDNMQVSSASQNQNSAAGDGSMTTAVIPDTEPEDETFIPESEEGTATEVEEPESEETKDTEMEEANEEGTDAGSTVQSATPTTEAPTEKPQATEPPKTEAPEAEDTVDETPATESGDATSNETATADPEFRLRMMIDYLVEMGVSERSELETEGTYANKAVNWISNEDHSVLAVPLIDPHATGVARNATDASSEEIFVNRYVMACLYFATGGDKWTKPLNFLSHKPTCDWYEPINGLPAGVGCLPSGHVVILFLSSNNLRNNLPSELGFLTDLIMLDVDRNWLMGELPDSFEALTALEHLHLGSNGIQGTLPAWITTFSNLRTLNLGYNTMNGPIPTELATMPLLEELALDHNLFEGDVNAMFSSTVGALAPLKDLYLDSNAFSGPLDENFLSGVDGLKQLDLSDNTFSGPFPGHIFSLPMIEVLDIHDNSFTSLPEAFPENCTLEFFAAQKNALVGSIPESIVELGDLGHLDLSQNKLTGTIPRGIGEVLVGLNYLFLAENDFTPGPIPFTFSNLYRLKELSFKSTARTGAVPNILGLLTELVFLDLDNNSLVGSVPSMFGSLTNLKMLLLNRNNFTEDIPSEIGLLSQLEVLFLEGNSFTGGLNDTCVGLEENKAEIIAQCDLCDENPGCCTLCCQEGDECNENTHVADLDPIWQLSYERDDYTLHAEEWWMGRRN